jgi:hypothetical protein
VQITATSGNCSQYLVSGCCPTGKSYCRDDGKCYEGGNFCQNYNSPSSCSGANSGGDEFGSAVGKNSVANSSVCGASNSYYYESAVLCSNITYCGCIWQNNQCKAIANATKICDDSTRTSYGYCTWTTLPLQDNCNNSLNNLVIRSTANWTGAANSQTPAKLSCIDVTKTLECASVERLPFFTFFNFAAALITITIAYFIINRRLVK